jgi:hypothetical protein
MSSVYRFSWMILNAGRRFALLSHRRSSMEHINCLSPTAAGSSLPVERRGQVSHGAQFLLPWADGRKLLVIEDDGLRSLGSLFTMDRHSASDTRAFIFQREQFPCLIQNARFEHEFLFYFSQGLR